MLLSAGRPTAVSTLQRMEARETAQRERRMYALRAALTCEVESAIACCGPRNLGQFKHFGFLSAGLRIYLLCRRFGLRPTDA